MPRCPLRLPQCTISSQSRPRCPEGYPNCPLNINRFPHSELRQEIENWSSDSLQTVLETFSDDEEFTTIARQLKANIDSGLLEQQ